MVKNKTGFCDIFTVLHLCVHCESDIEFTLKTYDTDQQEK